MVKHRPPTQRNIEAAHAWLDQMAALPMTHEELAYWLGIPVREVPTWKAGACEREIVKCNAIANGLKAKADAGEPRAVALMRQIEEMIEDLRRSRRYWASV